MSRIESTMRGRSMKQHRIFVNFSIARLATQTVDMPVSAQFCIVKN